LPIAANRLPPMALPVHFQPLGFQVSEDASVNKRAISRFMSLALLLGGSGLQPAKLSAQDAVSEAGKRKIRTKVDPTYPAIAKQMHVSGKVKIEVTISPDGRVTNTRVIGGSPLLVQAAISALNDWRFESGPKESTEVYEFEFNWDK
jgi:TonB family protein